MDDLISRQTLIDAFEEEFYTMYSDDYNYMIKFFKNLPSAKPTLYGYKIEHLAYIATVMEKVDWKQHREALLNLPAAEPKRGKWVEEDDDIIHGHCSSCGWVSVWQETDVFGMNYCPNCGARMEEI